MNNVNSAVWTCLLVRAKTMYEYNSIARVCKASAAAARVTKEGTADKFVVLEKTTSGWQHYLPTKKRLLHGSFGRRIVSEPEFYEISYFRFGARDVCRDIARIHRTMLPNDIRYVIGYDVEDSYIYQTPIIKRFLLVPRKNIGIGKRLLEDNK